MDSRNNQSNGHGGHGQHHHHHHHGQQQSQHGHRKRAAEQVAQVKAEPGTSVAAPPPPMLPLQPPPVPLPTFGFPLHSASIASRAPAVPPPARPPMASIPGQLFPPPPVFPANATMGNALHGAVPRPSGAILPRRSIHPSSDSEREDDSGAPKRKRIKLESPGGPLTGATTINGIALPPGTVPPPRGPGGSDPRRGPNPMEPDSSVTAPIDPVVAAAERAARCPLPTFVIAPHPNYSKLTAPVAVDADAIIPHPSRPLSGAAIEERDGRILFRVIRNDGASESSILLTGLKNIFQTQLPKMPRDYVGKLVYDKSHISICLIHAVTSKVLGGICFKPFLDRKFAEIVFCAVSNDVQVKGYGAHIMNHLKDHVREIGDIRHFLTYADNYAVGYFKKQGFSLEITLDKSIWMGYIKDYEGGTLMQCTIMPKVPYLDLPRILALQKQAVYRKIFSVSHANVIRPGIKHWPEGGLDPARIPGVAESGWTIELSRERAMPAKSPLHILLTGVVQWLMNHTASWPFKEPVDTKAIPDYLNVIKRPMDLKTMESKVNNDEYITEKEFVDDVQLIVDNCRTYNKKGSVYYQAAQKLERDFYKEFNGSLSM